MNEDEIRKVLRSAGADPGPRDTWQTFLDVAHRRRRMHHAAVGAVAALTLVAAAGVWAAASGVAFTDDPKPATEDDRREERTLEDDDVERLERGFRKTEENVDAVLPVRPPRRGDDRAVAAPGPGDQDGGDPPRDEGAVRDPRPGRRPPRGGGDLYGETCWGQIPTITGTNGRDTLRGTAGADVIVAGRGDDTISGAKADDHVCAGPGDDVLSGGGGRDRLLGGPGDDRLAGGTGYDFAVFAGSTAGIEADLLAGSASGEGTDVLDAVEGLVGSDFDDRLTGDVVGNLLGGLGGRDVLEGNGGGDVLVPGPADDVAIGGVGRDTISFQNGGWMPGEPGVEIDLRTGTVVGEGNDELIGVESATGTFGDDVFAGDSRFNTFDGYAGDDRATGGTAGDYLVGGPGVDTLDGGPDDDVLKGGDGVDTCVNGETTETCEAGTLDAMVLLTGIALALTRRGRASGARLYAAARRTTPAPTSPSGTSRGGPRRSSTSAPGP